MDRISSNFAFALILTISTLGLLPVIFSQIYCVIALELWPLVGVRFSFPLNILRTMDRISPNFMYALILTTSHCHFLPVCSRVMSLDFPLNILRRNGQNLTKFCINIDIDKV